MGSCSPSLWQAVDETFTAEVSNARVNTGESSVHDHDRTNEDATEKGGNGEEDKDQGVFIAKFALVVAAPTCRAGKDDDENAETRGSRGGSSGERTDQSKWGATTRGKIRLRRSSRLPLMFGRIRP